MEQMSQRTDYELEQIQFYKENNFELLFDLTEKIESKENAFNEVVGDLITHQVNKNPREMSDREKEIWFTRTLSKLTKVNNMMGFVISEIDKMRD